MKPQTLLLVSLLGNCALTFAAFHYAKSTPGFLDLNGQKNLAVHSNASSAASSVITNFVSDEFSWRRIETPDYKLYIANLRAIGCPEETIRDIIVADVNKLFRSKRNALMPGDDENKYWKSQNSWDTKEGRERQKKLRALDKEKSALLVELLGVDPVQERNKELGIVNYWDQRTDFLPDEKQAQFSDIQQKFQEQRQDIYRDGIFDADDWRKLLQIEKSETAELATFLTPEELIQYQLRYSHTADQLRSDLDMFEPSEEEFKEIFQLRQARADELISSNDPDDKETQQTRRKATDEINAQVKTLLGDARYAEYERSQDWSYKELARLTDRLELPKESAVAVYDMKKVAEEQVKRIRGDNSLSREQRAEALAAVRDATEKAVATSLGGEKNFNRYKSNGGWWINNLAPTPRKKSKVIVTP
jgi:hypothetical protein